MDFEVTSADDLLGLDAEWYARDEVGHVAVFTTAGEGFVPEAVWRNAESHLAAAVAVGTGEVPTTTTGHWAPDLPEAARWEGSTDLAAMGFYCYDADGSRSYRMVAVPDVPALVTGIPDVVARAARGVHYRRLRFSGLWRIDAEWLVDP